MMVSGDVPEMRVELADGMVSVRRMPFQDIRPEARPAIWEESGGVSALELVFTPYKGTAGGWKIYVGYAGPGNEPALTFLRPNFVGISELGRTAILDFGARRVFTEVKIDGAAYSLLPFGGGILLVCELEVMIIDRLARKTWAEYFSDVVSAFRIDRGALQVEFMDGSKRSIRLPDPRTV